LTPDAICKIIATRLARNLAVLLINVTVVTSSARIS